MPERSLRLVARVALLLTALPVVYFTTRGTWQLTYQINDGGWSGGYFWATAEALLVHLRLDVDPIHILGECFERDGRCYGYFGLTPTLLRVPVLGINRFFHSALTPVFMGTAILLALWAALQIVQRALRTFGDSAWPRPVVVTYFALVALALGPGSTLVFLSRPGVFEEAMAWGIAFTLLAANHAWKWQQGLTTRLWPVVLFAVAAGNARPTAVFACGVLGVALLAGRWQARRLSFDDRASVLALAVILLPALTAAGVFWLKVRTPLPSVRMSKQVQEAPHWHDILKRNGDRVGGLIFTPTALLTYFRPDTVIRTAEWPYFAHRITQETVTWVPPLPKDGAYVERTASLTTTMPLPWLLNLAAVAWLGLSLRAGRWNSGAVQVGGTLLGMAVAMTVLTVTTVGITTRYLGDFYLFSVFGAAFAPLAVLPWLSRRPGLAALAGSAAVLLVIWAVVVTLSLTVRVAIIE